MNDPQKAKRTTVSELAKTLAEKRSAASASVTVKVSAQGALQPEVVVTPDTTRDDIERMTELARWSVAEIMKDAKP